MEIVKHLDESDGQFVLMIRAGFDDEEMEIIERLGLRSCVIHVADRPVRGRHYIAANLKRAFRIQLGRIKHRWSPSLIRTSGLALVDWIGSLLGLVGAAARAMVDQLFGRRRQLSDAIDGITISSRRITDIKEAELFILVSLASIMRAIDYARQLGQEKIYRESDVMSELDGLDFAGAGGDIDGSSTDGLVKAGLIAMLIAVAAIAAMQSLGSKLETTFENVASAQGSVEGARQ